jgi:hypothetical protein
LKILFLCASLEAGRDGVGDYSTRLAEELRLQGHEIWIITINDKHLRENPENNVSDGDRMPMASRLSSSTGWRQRIRAIQRAVVESQPDWVSLQYVPYGFHHKGLPFLLPERLASLGSGFRWHVMFHELWYGDAPGSPWKHGILYRLQRHIVRRLLLKLHPLQVHTHIGLFESRLQKLGACPALLPLFGNIPVVESPAEPWGEFAFSPEAEIRGFLKCGVFGSVHPGSLPGNMLSEFVEVANHQGKPIFFIHFGGIGGAGGLDAWNSAMSHLPASARSVVLGPQSPEKISAILQHIDVGLATTPLSIAGKSGTVAAMRDHGLPVFFGAPDPFDAKQYPPGCFPPTREAVGRALAMERPVPRESVPDVCSQFLADLDRAEFGVGR